MNTNHKTLYTLLAGLDDIMSDTIPEQAITLAVALGVLGEYASLYEGRITLRAYLLGWQFGQI